MSSLLTKRMDIDFEREIKLQSIYLQKNIVKELLTKKGKGSFKRKKNNLL